MRACAPMGFLDGKRADTWGTRRCARFRCFAVVSNTVCRFRRCGREAGCAEALGVPRSVAAAMALPSLLCRALHLAAFRIPCWAIWLCIVRLGGSPPRCLAFRIASRRAVLPPALSVHAEDPSFAVPSGGVQSAGCIRHRRLLSDVACGVLRIATASPLSTCKVSSGRRGSLSCILNA